MDDNADTEHYFEDVVSSGDDAKIADAMVGFAFHHANWQWLFGKYMDIALSPTASSPIRALAYTCIGHLARIHADFTAEPALDFLKNALAVDSENIGVIEDAIGDLRMFHGPK